MPAGDHTGPVGQGPRTGRAAGLCAGYDVPGYMNPALGGGGTWGGYGRGYGGGFGGGRGWHHRFFATGLTGWQRVMRGRGGAWRGVLNEPATPVPIGADVKRQGVGSAGGPYASDEEELQRLHIDLRCLEESAARLRRRIAALTSQTSQESKT